MYDRVQVGNRQLFPYFVSVPGRGQNISTNVLNSTGDRIHENMKDFLELVECPYNWFIQNKFITIVHSNYKMVISSRLKKLLRIVWGSQLPRAGDIAILGGT